MNTNGKQLKLINNTGNIAYNNCVTYVNRPFCQNKETAYQVANRSLGSKTDCNSGNSCSSSDSFKIDSKKSENVKHYNNIKYITDKFYDYCCSLSRQFCFRNLADCS